MRSLLKRLIALSLLALVAPFRAGALGLGDIKLNSYLNQPLDAKITMLPGNTGPLDQVRVKLAPQAAFEQAGIERLPVLDHIKFSVVKGQDGKPQIKLSSDTPIKEPFLDFILQVNWPNGRISREYTVLLDPPTTTAEHAPPVQPATTAAAQGQDTSGSNQTAAGPKPAVAAAAATPAAQGDAGAGTDTRSFDAKLTKDTYGRTQRDDTLWSIAKAVRPDDSVSVQQVMLALVKKNPEAFYQGNVNTLKAGYILRLPKKDLINHVSQVDAIHEVQRQYHQWQQIKQGSLLADAGDAKAGPAAAGHGAGKGTGTPKAEARKGADAGSGNSARKAKTADEARLTLLPASAGKAGAGGAAAASTAKEGQAGQGAGVLKKQLDTLQKTQQKQIEDLRTQVDALNQQVSSMQRLLSVKDNTLSTLQQKLGTAQGNPAAAQVSPKPADTARHAKSASVQPPKTAHQGQAAHPKPHPAPPAHKASPRPVHADTHGGLLADPKVLGLGGVVVLLLSALSWISVRRRRMHSESLSPEPDGAAPAEQQEAAAEQTPDKGEQYMPSGGDLLEAEINEIDPLAEADVYMAYRRYQQAEDLLRGAIEQEPHRHELQLKLAEVFAAAGNAPAFIAEAQNLHNELAGQDGPIWNKMVEMGREIQPDHPLFAGGEGPAVPGEPQPVAVPGGDQAPAVVDQAPAFTAAESTDTVPAAAGDQADLDGAAAVAGLDETRTAGPEALPDLQAEPAAEAPVQEQDRTPGAGDEDNSIDFEAGLGQSDTAAGDEPASDTEVPQGNEIDFEPAADSGSGVDQDQIATVAGTPESDPLDGDELPAGAAGPGEPEPRLSGLETDASGDDTPDLTQQPDGTAEGGAAQAATADEAPAHDLDFDIDFGKIAGRDQDFDNFFEELESPDAGDASESSDADAGPQDVGTKLDLAKAFMEMGDQDGAKEILQEVVELGDEGQKQEARGLLQQLQV